MPSFNGLAATERCPGGETPTFLIPVILLGDFSGFPGFRVWSNHGRRKNIVGIVSRFWWKGVRN
jgi:hypothetical protein